MIHGPQNRATGQRETLVHCRRVAALAAELSRTVGATTVERDILMDAGLAHHYPAELLSIDTIGPALKILTRQSRPGAERPGGPPRLRHLSDVVEVLVGFHSGSLSRRGDALTSILATASFVVDRLESASGVETREAVFDALRRKTGEGLISTVAYKSCMSLPRLRGNDLAPSIARLPVFPTIALRVLALAAKESVCFADLSALVSKDQVLAGHLISAANSCLYSPNGKISSIGHAISYIGLDESRRIITAASIRPVFASGGLGDLWKHSLEGARWCEEAAIRAGGLRKDDAFLAGLVHDVGRLLVLKHSGEISLTFVRLTEQGCDPAFAEKLLFGRDHAGLGAEILRAWKFPDAMVDAVLHHHTPDESAGRLASLLFLAVRAVAEDKVGIAGGSLECGAADLGLLRVMYA
jgi:putative nucleotidyltransferase with HDIG domain